MNEFKDMMLDYVSSNTSDYNPTFTKNKENSDDCIIEDVDDEEDEIATINKKEKKDSYSEKDGEEEEESSENGMHNNTGSYRNRIPSSHEHEFSQFNTYLNTYNTIQKELPKREKLIVDDIYEKLSLLESLCESLCNSKSDYQGQNITLCLAGIRSSLDTMQNFYIDARQNMHMFAINSINKWISFNMITGEMKNTPSLSSPPQPPSTTPTTNNTNNFNDGGMPPSHLPRKQKKYTHGTYRQGAIPNDTALNIIEDEVTSIKLNYTNPTLNTGKHEKTQSIMLS